MAVIGQVFTTVGEQEVIDALIAGAIFKYLGVGTGAGVVAKGDADLWTPATEARVTGVLTEFDPSTLQAIGTTTFDGTKIITEFGLFDAAGAGSPPSGGNLICHYEIDPQGVELNDQIEWTARLEMQ